MRSIVENSTLFNLGYVGTIKAKESIKTRESFTFTPLYPFFVVGPWSASAVRLKGAWCSQCVKLLIHILFY